MPKWTDEQALAIHEKGKNIIVSAGAGSGKTAVLSERVLEHVKSGVDIEDLLVLTFTNAAASEMKQRIRKKLMAFPSLKEQADKTLIAYITTFDAYALSMVKKYNHLLNVSSNVTIVDTGVIMLKKREILTNIFESRYKCSDELFLKLIGDFCLKDDKEVFEAIMNINNKLDNLYNKREYLEGYLDNYFNDEKMDEFISEYLLLIKKKILNIKSVTNYLSSYTEGEYISKVNGALFNLLAADDYDSIKRGIPDKLPSLPRGSSLEAKEIKKQLTNLINEISELTKYDGIDEIKRTLFLTKDYVRAIISILLEFDDEVLMWKKANDAYEFIDISKMAIKVLEENKEVRDELKGKYKEILIDEYQDTNDLQDLFISYIENNNVYMVGDIKQSIYRFRNANPLLFKGKYDNYASSLEGMKIDLNRNFRSRKEVSDNINLIFNLIMNDDIGGADYTVSHQMAFGNTAYDKVNSEDYNMEILNYAPLSDKSFSKEEIEIFTIARDISNKVKNGYKIMDKDTLEERSITYGDFVILMDRSSSFETYKKIFEYLNIPLMIYRDKAITNSVDILLIKNLYRIIMGIKERCFDVNFKYAFMSILRSYLYRLDDSEIFKIISEKAFKGTDLYEKCFKISLEIDVLNNRELYDRIINDFDFYEKVISVGDIDEHIVTLDSIGKIADNLCDLGYGPKEFLNYLDDISKTGLDIKLSLNKESSNSVKIMTIHASKGLEYYVCYYSGLYKKFNIDDLKSKFYFSLDYGLLVPYFDGGIKNTILKTLLKNSYLHEEISEKLRLFYVALTRAREKMILVTELKPDLLSFKDNGVINDEVREKYLSFADMVNSIASYLSSYVRDVDVSDLGLTKDYNLGKKGDFRKSLALGDSLIVSDYECDDSLVLSDSFSKKAHSLFSLDDLSNIDLGLEMHRLFELSDFDNPDYSGLDDFKRRKIEKFIASGILDNKINLYKEYEFIYFDEKEFHGVIDLLIEYPLGYAIVDYKLKDTTDDAYLNQLNGYKKYIEMMTGKDVQTYLYSILDEKLIKL